MLAAFDRVIQKWQSTTDPAVRCYVVLALHSKGIALNDLAQVSRDQEKFYGAMQAFAQIVEQFSDDKNLVIQTRVARSFFYLGEVFQGNGDTKTAQGMFGEIVKRFGVVDEREIQSIVLSAVQRLLGLLPASLELGKFEMELSKKDTPEANGIRPIVQMAIKEIENTHKATLSALRDCLAKEIGFALYLRNFDVEGHYRNVTVCPGTS